MNEEDIIKHLNSIILSSPTSFEGCIASLSKNHIKFLRSEINKLKCCGNCKHALTMSQMGLHDTRPCKDCVNESLWEMED